MREGVRRQLKLWDHWTRMMVYGWFDPVGRPVPILTMEEMMTVRKGKPRFARELGKGENGALLRKLADGKVVLREELVKKLNDDKARKDDEAKKDGETAKDGEDGDGGGKKTDDAGQDGEAAKTVSDDKDRGDDESGEDGEE